MSPVSRSGKRWFYASLAVIAMAEIVLLPIFGRGESDFAFEDFPAWGSLYGFVSCVAIVVVSKLVGKLWLTRPEDYYDS